MIDVELTRTQFVLLVEVVRQAIEYTSYRTENRFEELTELLNTILEEKEIPR